MIVAGVGLRPGCDAAELATLVMRAAAQAGRGPDRLAVPYFRADAASVREAAALLSLSLDTVHAEALRAMQPFCPTQSAQTLAATGYASVAEACALAAAGPGGRLVLSRIASSGATCALAEGAGAATMA